MFFYGFQVALAAIAFKTLFFNEYHSTDFEVHRNWLAITNSLPISKWYTEATSKWTLDYPPFFAYFEWFLSQIGRKFDPNIVVITTDPHVSATIINFQRCSVVASELVLIYSIISLLTLIVEPLGEKGQPIYLSAVALFAFNFGLFVVDHIHFQYNGFLFGILFLSILNIFKGSFLWGGFWFAVLLNFKHIFLYIAPVYFAFILLHYCLDSGKAMWRFHFDRLVKMAVIVGGVFALSLGPFLYMGKLNNLLARLFPFHRGLCHSYWAPNFWALYNALDKFMSISGKFGNLCSTVVVDEENKHVGMTSGLTGNYIHVCLPNVQPIHTLLLTALCMAPSLFFTKKRRGSSSVEAGFTLVRAIVAAAWASFLCGWHVHEKAILMVTLPLLLLAVASRQLRGLAFYVTTLAHFSLLPLVFTPNEQPAVLSLYALFTVTQHYLLGRCSTPVSGGPLHTVWPILSVLAKLHLAGLVPLLLANRCLLPRVLPHLEFLPLMLTSVYCAVGLVVGFVVYVGINATWLADEREAILEEEADEEYYRAKAAFLKKLH